jgi:branched-chain amino acid transport system ATP-binding protein
MALLECRDISISFGGVRALNDVNIVANEGTVTGLIGPNGAGKTTMFNCITGLLEPNSGSLQLDGREIRNLKPFKRARLGIARTFQRLELFTSLSVRDNIRVAGEIRNRWHKGRIDVAAETQRVLDTLRIDHLADQLVSEIPTGMARRVEMGRALMTHPRILLLDEPASGQDEHETVEFGELLLELAAAGTGILLVEHDVSLVMRVCSYIQVLDFGRIIATGTPEEIRNSPEVISAYLGDEQTA